MSARFGVNPLIPPTGNGNVVKPLFAGKFRKWVGVLDLVSAMSRHSQAQAARPTLNSEAKHKPNIRFSFGRPWYSTAENKGFRIDQHQDDHGRNRRIDSPGREVDTNLLPAVETELERNRVKEGT